eukprot:TRINITY_DN9123_c0_g1_i1.p1 TRINITY_DN9123_c0_g1~~TRINITY_DN9123_c0_g1_i1.p1  ORF type:complete len:124 (+),score=17.19 TRINITY_DN9123_c0_g1_i1:45-374(+)
MAAAVKAVFILSCFAPLLVAGVMASKCRSWETTELSWGEAIVTQTDGSVKDGSATARYLSVDTTGNATPSAAIVSCASHANPYRLECEVPSSALPSIMIILAAFLAHLL